MITAWFISFIQDYGHLGLPESQKINASTGSLGHGVIFRPLSFPTEQCKVCTGSLVPVLLPSPHQCRWTEGCTQPCADCSQFIITQTCRLCIRTLLSHLHLASGVSSVTFAFPAFSCHTPPFLQSPKCLAKRQERKPFHLPPPGSSQIINWIIVPDPRKAA